MYIAYEKSLNPKEPMLYHFLTAQYGSWEPIHTKMVGVTVDIST